MIKYYLLRLIYRFLFWFCDVCGGAAGDRIVIGFYTKFKHHHDIKDEDLYSEICRLENAVMDGDK